MSTCPSSRAPLPPPPFRASPGCHSAPCSPLSHTANPTGCPRPGGVCASAPRPLLPAPPLPMSLSALPTKPLEGFSASHCGRIRAGVIGGHSPGSSGEVPKASGTERVFLFIFKIIPLNPEQLRKSPQYVQINKANILQADFLS